MSPIFRIYTTDDSKYVLTNRHDTVTMPKHTFIEHFGAWTEGQLAMSLDWDEVKRCGAL